jgi:single-strand DNA-binding protein
MGGLEFQPVNNVELCGRVSSAPSERELPSGDVVLELRLVVPRIDRSGVDTLDLAFWKAGLRRRARNLGVGALRRRFWQGSAGVTSRSQVEVTGLVKVI